MGRGGAGLGGAGWEESRESRPLCMNFLKGDEAVFHTLVFTTFRSVPARVFHHLLVIPLVILCILICLIIHWFIISYLIYVRFNGLITVYGEEDEEKSFGC